MSQGSTDLLPRIDRNTRVWCRKITYNRLRVGQRPIDQANLGDAAIAESSDNSPGRPPGAEDRRRASRRFPNWYRVVQALKKAKGIRVAAFEHAVRPNHDSVHRANPPRQRLEAVDHSERCLLVRVRQITSTKAKDRQCPKRLLDMLRPHRQWEIS